MSIRFGTMILSLVGAGLGVSLMYARRGRLFCSKDSGVPIFQVVYWHDVVPWNEDPSSMI